jgi:hypothetical protein
MNEKKTPGQAAYEVWAQRLTPPITRPWGQLPEDTRATWDAAAQAAIDPVAAERDKAYGERAHLVAYLAACYPSAIDDGDDHDPDWPVIAITTPSGQMTWHIALGDLDAFDHIPGGSVEWDGHTTEEKYRRLARLTRTVASGLYGPQPTADL